MSNIRVGCDPELFFINHKGGFTSIVGLLGGTKKKPKPIGCDCFVQEDNVAAEFNIPPAISAAEFVRSIQYNLTYLNNRAKELGLELAIVPSAKFNPDELNTPGAQTFGCEPDFNAWKLEVNGHPKAADPNLRSAGGHIHLETKDDPIQTIRAMDLFIGAQLVAVDKDKNRRELYGKAGAFREKSYGVEYRTPSNIWITNEGLMKWVYTQCEKVKEWVAAGHTLENDDTGLMIQDCINNSDTKLLKELNSYYGLQPIST